MEDSSIGGPSAQYFRDPTPLEDRSGAGHDSAPAICRICRGEATPTEPLFYPCKCSGSIKFVHQECLMVWLSHSQKKYCELCKTSFRFTKLYAPDMPKSLPVHIFLEHMAKYIFRHLLVWLRAILAVCVWAFGLPYFMRAVWSFMFWISDEGLGTTSGLARSDTAASATTTTLASSVLDDGTCPSSPLLAAPTTSVAHAKAVVGQLVAEDLSEFLFRFLRGSFGMPTAPGLSNSVASVNQSATPASDTIAAAPSSSLLSNVALFKTITRSPTLNRAIVAVLEGQAITVLIIVSFILVILVRDYVVQQQPEINMRAAFVAPENQGQEPDQANDAVPQQNDHLQDTDDTASEDGPVDHHEQNGGQDWPAPVFEANEEPVLGAVVQHIQDPASMAPGARQVATEISHESAAVEPLSQSHTDDGDRDLMEDEDNKNEFQRIYRRADGNLEEILRIMEEEGLQDKLSYWFNFIRRSQKTQESRRAAPIDPAVRQPDHFQPEGSSTAERVMPQSSSPTLESEDKGKGPAPAPLDPASASPDLLCPPDFEPYPPRPRAISDGPQVQHSVNPLASNTWTFAALDNQVHQSEPQASSSGPRSALRTDHLENASSYGAYFHDSEADIPLDSAWNDEDVDSEAVNASSAPWEALQVPLLADDLGQHPLLVEDDQSWNDQAMTLLADEQVDDDDDVDVVDDVGGNDADNDMDVGDDSIDEDEANDQDDEAADDLGGDGANAAFDAEAIEDMEDFEGVMELIGMRGPIAGLFQNAIFCAVLVSVTIFVCIFLPYNIGRIALWILARPMRLVRMLFELSKLTQDAAVLFGGLGSWFVLNIVDIFTKFVGGSFAAQVVAARKLCWALWTNAGSRVLDCVFIDFPMTASEIQNFSATSHEALNTVKGNIMQVFDLVDHSMLTLSKEGLVGLSAGAANLLASVSETTASVSAWLMDPSAWVINFGGVEERLPIDPELAHWSSFDRFLAIVTGYVSVCMLSALYLQRDGPFSRGTVMHAWEVGIIDTLQQASGILKVILIISIEMLVFPLYCGLLLDLALLPLFEGATFKSRMLFTYNYPMTSVFVHWFVGTGYMFHFALFVSMCRKIMRPGVLYFIRDPDDPEFHPVRDVLERNLTTQLRKILFSAFVYGALVIVCLGGVVWGLAFAVPDVLPIHYSSNEPVLEFPVDLLFYNFLMPLAVKFFKPSDALHTMYTWWFRKCARSLRLTSFLFGERRIDEEGTLQLRFPTRSRDFSRGMLLEVDETTTTVIPKTWRDTFEGGDAKPNPPTTKIQRKTMRRKKHLLVATDQIAASGQFVRAPASDRVKIPPGQAVFLPVNERGRREDGQADTGIYASDQYQLVYIPSNFRTRIFVFIVSIWVFAAVTGVGLTILPLVFGRRVFKTLIPEHIRTNDIYAFSIGIFTLGTVFYSAFHARSMMSKAQAWTEEARRDVLNGTAARRVLSTCAHAAKLVYAYFFLLIVFPLLASTMVELYLTVPLHTYMYPPATLSTEQDAKVDRHTVRVIQSWTLGLLYLKLGSRMITSLFPDSRAAHAVRSIMRRGWLRPDIKLLTRAFISPGLVISAAAILAPPTVAHVVIHRGRAGTEDPTEEAAEAVRLVVMYRQSYPAAAFAAILARNVVTLVNALDHWTAGVRDEAYLIGERLHNFGAGAGVRKGRRIWGGGRQRL
ncbi:ERAD-associated E3 ubiquitin-protein ligase doa10 [Escovopsis weberi]|uniref:RING-type E3 ubiquitin transferase n=1 Tax=Escovopsis weberi TaxID=150374 RepID=A0A0M8MZV3_ESCWE|nr:ERAD-associated E3 ubiquitin-protein ligase doa10 [Escovopsis weberi]